MFEDCISINIGPSSFQHSSTFANKLKIRKFSPILDESENISINYISTPKENIRNARIINIEDVTEKIVIQPSSNRRKFHSLKTNKNDSQITKPRSSRSTKRLLRTLNKPCSGDHSQFATTFDCDTIILDSANKKQIKQLTSPIWIRCKICKKRIAREEEKLQSHYRIVHNFLFMKTKDSDVILTRLKVNKKYFHFCCLSCWKKFVTFDHFIQHRCKNMQRKAFADGKNDLDIKIRPSMADFEIDYECEREFFQNLGLQRKLECQTEFKCDHMKNEKFVNSKTCNGKNFVNSLSQCLSMKKSICPVSRTITKKKM
ncbi:uncharacterized protein LOC142597484 [Dermatophagoides farinae]|uniref:uncharacterized protein LOC142597484 n=1 Tax=Dermatophagoides farinae TaxID=6954 RepID=UPI003F646BB6